MYGNEPGAERKQGVLNQHELTVLSGTAATFFVLHTRAESPVSVLIEALTKEAKQKGKDVEQFVIDSVISIQDVKLMTKSDYERVKDERVKAWGTGALTPLSSLLQTATISCVVGVKGE